MNFRLKIWSRNVINQCSLQLSMNQLFWYVLVLWISFHIWILPVYQSLQFPSALYLTDLLSRSCEGHLLFLDLSLGTGSSKLINMHLIIILAAFSSSACFSVWLVFTFQQAPPVAFFVSFPLCPHRLSVTLSPLNVFFSNVKVIFFLS